MTASASILTSCRCGAQLAPTLLACPRCAALVHSDRLDALAAKAREASARHDTAAALAAWREAIELLPPDSRQHQIIAAKIAELSGAAGRASSSAASGDGRSSARKAAAGLGAAGLLLWKFKLVLVFLIAKAKLLLLGLTQIGTVLSMLVSFGAYWTLWGWQFALGLVLSIYVHEMGHVVALRRLGFKAGAPVFIPGLGALIRLRQHPANASEDAVIGLAGPIYGLAAAAASLALWALTGHRVFAAIGGVGAWINLFNLLPVWTLDGGRAFPALSRPQRFAAAAASLASWLIVRDGMILLLLIIIAGRASMEPGPKQGDRRAAMRYVLLIVALSVMSLVRFRLPTR